ncbi:hypothetical protein [Gimesia panareensis]|nr:hypothetical protein [Gimesia panareensis]
MFKEHILKFGLVLVLPIFILLLPVTLPLIGIQLKRDQKRKRTLAERFVCVECGEVIGLEAIRLADERWSKIVEKILSENNTEIRLRLVRTVDAICPHCGCQYCYREEEQTFVVQEVSPEWKRLEQRQDAEERI